MRGFIHLLLAAALTLALNPSAIGDATQGEKQAHSLPAHVHGNAQLQLVLEADQLLLALHSPAMNLLGFEHDVHGPEQLAMVESTRAKLAKANTLFLFTGGECVLNQQSLDLSAILTAEKSAHPSHQQENNSHSDIEATYQYTCLKPNDLQTITLMLHTVFPSIEFLQVQWIIRNRQGAATLNDKHNEIHFR
ncbi:MAG: DUF2796 domain-containing protein [Spongiibacteraceae bacterium]|nr:DUF2796 domain-containing protein [Spongiibacteraceae bacterium]